MKRILLALAAAAAMLVSCNEPAPDHIDLVTINSFGFYAKDNPKFLTEDYVVNGVDNSATSIKIAIPYDIRIDSLIARFELPKPAIATNNGTEVISGDTPLDYTKAVDLIFTQGENSRQITVNVVPPASAGWELMAESESKVSDIFTMAINPKDNMPYFLARTENVTIPNPEDESKPIESGQFPILLAPKSGILTNIAGNLNEYKTDYLALDFTNEGTAYAVFKDNSEEAGGKSSVVRIKDGKSEFIGKGVLTKNGGNKIGSAAVTAISDNNVYTFQYDNDSKTGLRRAIFAANYNGSDWTTKIQLPGRELNERSWTVISKKINGVPYLYVLNFAKISMSVYKFENDKWIDYLGEIKPVAIDGNTPITTAEYRYGSQDFDIASNGDIYIACSADFSEAGVKNVAVVKISKTSEGALTQSIVGGGIIKGLEIEKIRDISLSLDKNDVPYLAYGNVLLSDKPAGIMHIDSQTKAWTEPTLIHAHTENISLKFAEDGSGYLSYYDKNSEKLVCMKKID